MKKTMTTKVVSLLLAFVMLLSLAACGKSGAQTEVTAAPTENVKAWTADDSAEISIMMFGENTPNEENMVLDALEEATGTKISMSYINATDYPEKLNAVIAGGELPDLFWVTDLSLATELMKAGMVADMEAVLNTVAPNYIEQTKELLHMPAVNADGAYLLMNSNASYQANVCLRADWLKNLGLEMPTNLDEFAEVMHAFTYDDPDGNGKDDTYGYSFSLECLQGQKKNGQNLFGAFGIPKGYNIELEDGTVTTWVKHPHFLEAIQYIRSLIADGVCEPDYATIPTMTMFEKLWNGTAGCLEWECVGPTNNWMPARYVEDPAPEFDFAILEGPHGDKGVPAGAQKISEGWMVSADCDNMEGVARIANFLMSEEGSNLLVLGVEGVMYEWVDKENGTVKYLPPYDDNATHRANGGYCYIRLFMPRDNAEVRILNEQTQKGVALAWSNGIDYVVETAVSDSYAEYGSDMGQIVNEMIAKLLSCTDDKLETVYADFATQWEDAGGSEWEKEATEIWKQSKSN